MARKIYKTAVVTLDGFQSILQPGKFGYGLQAVVGDDLIQELEEDREEALKWAVSKLKNPKRSVLRPEPWEDNHLKFRWDDKKKPPVVDTVGKLVDEHTPIYSGSKVKLAFEQKPYVLQDGSTYGTSLKLIGIQVVALSTGAGLDTGDMDADAVASLFGNCDGFVSGDPNVTNAEESEDNEDF